MAGVGQFIEVNIDGLKELETNLLKLPEDLAKRGLGRAARDAMKLLQLAIAFNAPKLTGTLQRGIQMRSKFIGDGVQGGTIVVSIGLKLSPKEESAFYGRFLEFGTVKMPARAFMKPEFDAHAQEVLANFGKELGEEIEKVARRAKVKL